MKLLRFALAYIVLALGAVPMLVGCTFLLPWRVQRIRYVIFYGRYLAGAVLASLGVKIRYKGLDGRTLGPAVFVANHASTMDMFLIALAVPTNTSVVIKKELIFVPIIGQMALLSGNLLIDRFDHGNAVKGLEKISATVRRGNLSLLIMPEGTRSKNDSLLHFKRGFVHLAIATGLPVVPVIFHGAASCWPMSGLLVSPGEVVIETLDPVSSANWSADDAGRVADDFRAQFGAALARGA